MDARYPERYLHDRRISRLTDAEHRAYVLALVWSVANRTDGAISVDDLDALPKAVTRETLDGLKRAELVTEQLVGGDLVWLLTDYRETQTTRAELESLDAARRAKRLKLANKRGADAAEILSAVPGTTEDRARARDRDRARTEPGQATKEPPTDSTNGKSWPVVDIPRPKPLPPAAGAEDELF
jgi:hypothetical protein